MSQVFLASSAESIDIEDTRAARYIADYWGSKKNPTHCCVHPLEYPDPAHAGFLAAIGQTTGDEIFATSLDYKNLLAGWLIANLP